MVTFLLLMPFQDAEAQGPVIISGLDTEWGIRPWYPQHGTIAMWRDVVQTGIIGNVTNNQAGPILVIGGGGPVPNMTTSFWDQVAAALPIPKSVVYSNASTGDISTISFSGYSMIAISTTYFSVTGRLTATELADISARKSAIANFVNAGGGLFASSCDISPVYGYIDIGKPPLISVNGGCSNSSPTTTGSAMGLVSIVGPFHNRFTQFPSFLSVLSTCGGDDVILGGTSVTIPSDNDGAYCCEDENLVENGNFEAGNTGFFSTYNAAPTVNPGEFNVTANANPPFGTVVTDHSFCEDDMLYPNNDMYMVVNGKTQQPGPNSVIWAQAISGLEEGEKYKFCANFKNMPQCTFDILPNIAMVGPGGAIVNQVINTGSGPCAWQNMELTFTAGSTTETVAIYLYETGNGDGNDVAVDDIAVFKVQDPDLSISVQHQGNPQEITASINTIGTGDDELHGEDCEYFWFAAEVDSYPPIIINGATLGWGNMSGHYGYRSGPDQWGLTTTFDGYTPWSQNTLYIIGMYTPACDCYDEGFTYQLTFNNRSVDGTISLEQQQEIIDIILNGFDGESDTSVNDEIPGDTLKIYPNPTKNNVTISLANDTIAGIEVLSVSGQRMDAKPVGSSGTKETIDVSTLPVGMYFVRVLGESGKQYAGKLVKE